MTRLAAALLLALGVTAFSTAPAAWAADDPLTFRGSLSWINAASNSTSTESAVNPDNQVLQLPDHSFVSEFRPNLKIGNGQIQFIARPRVHFEASRVVTGEGDDEKTH